ncbi:hypothetical protein SAMN04489724_0932 [Algoriphagus locisalis]|uniref:6-bladed beta-propeller protein n=1 Tax=Algoriphagus locisalis TaxID=305507 RepID=A0A1I6YC32_9BACT|nr:6-bladed beta-propeller [Algoriphagus locisalis]SFT48076.1 hypothetical protein SAMN04489724_0932 [Algoriphagus locisalis]
MNFSKVIFLSLCILLFQFCTNKNEVEVEQNIHKIEISKEFLLDDENGFQIEALDTIDLERPGNPPLTFIQDIAFSKDYIFLVDNKKGLLKFDYEGNFIQTIGKKGEGPDEYNVVTTIYVDEKRNRILLAVWDKMVVNSYDMEGNFIASSKKLAGQPISFYKEDSTILVIQESLDSKEKDGKSISISSMEPTTLEFKTQENPLYSFTSKFNRFYNFLNVFGKVNQEHLFYMPRVLFAGLVDQKDTIYRMKEDHLVPGYQLDFTDFGKSDTLRIEFTEINDGHASILLLYKKDSYHLMLDLAHNTPKFSYKLPFKGVSLEGFPKHLNADTYYRIIRNEDAQEEENPKIVMSSLTKGTN